MEGLRLGFREVSIAPLRQTSGYDEASAEAEAVDAADLAGGAAAVAAAAASARAAGAHKVLCLNGQRLRLCGVNRHEHDGFAGKAISDASMVAHTAIACF